MRKRRRPKKRWMDTEKDEMLRWGLSDEDADYKMTFSDRASSSAEPPPIRARHGRGEKVRQY